MLKLTYKQLGEVLYMAQQLRGYEAMAAEKMDWPIEFDGARVTIANGYVAALISQQISELKTNIADLGIELAEDAPRRPDGISGGIGEGAGE